MARSILSPIFWQTLIGCLSLIMYMPTYPQVGQSVWHLLNNDCFLAQSFEDIVMDSFITFTQLDELLDKACTIESLLDVVETVNTFTAINDIIMSSESKIAVIESIIDIDFNGTFTLLDEVSSKISDIESKVSGLDPLVTAITTTVNAIYQNVLGIETGVDRLDLALHPETKADAILQEAILLGSRVDRALECSTTPITQLVTTITAPGSYCLAQNVTGPIIISASNVNFDLKNNTITGGSQGIIVNSELRNIKIFNGAIKGVTNQAILIQSGAQVSISKIRTTKCNIGIDLDGATSCLITNCQSLFNNYGIILENNAQANVIDNYLALRDTAIGFELLNSHTNILINCNAIDTGFIADFIPDVIKIEPTSIGFLAQNGTCNTFDSCFATNITTTGLMFNEFAAAFVLKGHETKSKIINSNIGGTSTNKDGISTPFGILMLADLELPTAVSVKDTINVIPNANSVSWMPTSSHFIAVGGGSGAGNNIQIFSFDNQSTLNLVTTATHGNIINSVSFSSASESVITGSLLVAGGIPADDVDVILFAFNQSTLTEVDTFSHGGTVNVVAFEPFGTYVGVGGEVGFDGNELRVLNIPLDGSMFVAASAAIGQPVTTLTWSSLGELLAVADESNTVSIFKFDGTSLTFITSFSRNAPIYSLSWSPYCEILAVGGAATDGHTIEVYLFNETTITQVATGGPSIEVRDLEWIQAASNVLATIQSNNGGSFNLFSFNGTSLNLVATQSSRGRSLSWSYDGRNVATTTEAGALRILSTDFALPIKCFINNNLISNLSGGCGALGIEGYSYSNLIINNICYETDLPFSFGVTNIYKDGINGIVHAFQNIGIPPYSSLDPANQLIENIQNPVFRAIPGSTSDANFLVEQANSFFLNIRNERQGILNIIEVMMGLKPPSPVGRQGRQSERLEIDISGNVVSLREQEQQRGRVGRIGRRGRLGRRGRR